KATNDAIALFGNTDAAGIVLLKPYREYYSEYAKKIGELLTEYRPGDLIIGEEDQVVFVKRYGETLRLRNILTSFDEFANDEILSDRDKQDYQSTYLDLYNERKRADASDKENTTEDVVFEIERIKQVEITVDCILLPVQKDRAGRGDGAAVELRAGSRRAG